MEEYGALEENVYSTMEEYGALEENSRTVEEYGALEENVLYNGRIWGFRGKYLVQWKSVGL